MTGEQIFGIVIVAIVVFTLAFIQLNKNGNRIKRAVLNRLGTRRNHQRAESKDQLSPASSSDPGDLTPEESEAELQRLQKLVDDRKQIAWDTDIAHHLWGFYETHFRKSGVHSLDRFSDEGEWYDVKVLNVRNQDGLNQHEFELKGARYKFVDDEERQGWRVRTKLFSLFLYDDSGHCLIEVPMKVIIDGLGHRYSISSGGPKAFLEGDWINDFINVRLKHQSIRNQEIRTQKHEERLYEIEDLKDRFGIVD